MYQTPAATVGQPTFSPTKIPMDLGAKRLNRPIHLAFGDHTGNPEMYNEV